MNPKIVGALVAAMLSTSTAVAFATPAAAAPEVYYKNCDAARAAGAAPINRGEPGYRPALDRDNDGVACEQRGSDKDKDRDEDKDRDRDDSSSDNGDGQQSDSTTSRDRTDESSPGGPSGARSYGQIGEDDVPVGGVNTGGWPAT